MWAGYTLQDAPQAHFGTKGWVPNGCIATSPWLHTQLVWCDSTQMNTGAYCLSAPPEDRTPRTEKVGWVWLLSTTELILREARLHVISM